MASVKNELYLLIIKQEIKFIDLLIWYIYISIYLSLSFQSMWCWPLLKLLKRNWFECSESKFSITSKFWVGMFTWENSYHL